VLYHGYLCQVVKKVPTPIFLPILELSKSQDLESWISCPSLRSRVPKHVSDWPIITPYISSFVHFSVLMFLWILLLACSILHSIYSTTSAISTATGTESHCHSHSHSHSHCHTVSLRPSVNSFSVFAPRSIHSSPVIMAAESEDEVSIHATSLSVLCHSPVFCSVRLYTYTESHFHLLFYSLLFSSLLFSFLLFSSLLFSSLLFSSLLFSSLLFSSLLFSYCSALFFFFFFRHISYMSLFLPLTTQSRSKNALEIMHIVLPVSLALNVPSLASTTSTKNLACTHV
jgi:hypothetical protein